MDHLPNTEFLKQYQEGTTESFILPHEKPLVEAQLAQLGISEGAGKQAAISSEDWRDGASVVENELRLKSERATKLGDYLTARVVDYPAAEDEQVTLGSLVTVQHGREEYNIRVVGIPSLYEQDDFDNEVCSPKSPVAKSIIGKRVGEVATFTTGSNRQQRLTIKNLVQTNFQQD